LTMYIAVQDATVASLVETYVAAHNVCAVRVPHDALFTKAFARGNPPPTIIADLPPDRQARARLCRWLRNSSLTHSANVVLLLDNDNPDQTSSLRYATGAQVVLTKPFALSQLVRAVARLATQPQTHSLHIAAYAGYVG
jgi:DNA-binding response OmpR family regulator